MNNNEIEIEREGKQNYLREHILEKEYNTNQFLEFLISIKGEDAADVDIWTMDELKEVVSSFIEMNNDITEESKNNNKEAQQHSFNSDEEKKSKDSPIRQEVIHVPQNVVFI